MNQRWSIATARLFRRSLGIITLAALWEVAAKIGLLNAALAPPLETIWAAMASMIVDGTIFINTAYTLARVLLGLLVGCVVGVPLGVLLGRSRLAEKIMLPFITVLMPIPSFAWVPLLILWFGLGNVTTVLIVIYATSFPLFYGAWTGVRSINPLWVKSAQIMGASRSRLFWQVILPGAAPHLVTGLRLGFGRGWIAVIGAELLAGTDWGLGRLIFEATEWLSTDVVLASLIIIGAIGLFFERTVFQVIESKTVGKWGMLRQNSPTS